VSDLLLKRRAGEGRIVDVTPESAGWTYVGFELHRLRKGQSVAAPTGDREACLVFIAGKGRTRAGAKDFGLVGERMSPFDGKPWSVYVPQGSDWSVEAAIKPRRG
jgi:5-deoxy-glucuronate isomerase